MLTNRQRFAEEHYMSLNTPEPFELIQALAILAKLRWPEETINDIAKEMGSREVTIFQGMAHYAHESGVFIEFEGSPARFPIYISDMQAAWGIAVVVNRQYIKDPATCDAIRRMVKHFIVNRPIL